MLSNVSSGMRRAFAGLLPAYFGFAFSKVWISLVSPYCVSNGAADTQLLFPFSFGVSALIVAIASLKFSPSKLHRALFPVSLIAMLVISPMLQLASQSPSPSPTMLAAVIFLSALGVTCASALWVDFFALFSPLRAALLNAGAILIAVLVNYMLKVNTPPRLFAVLAVIAALTALTYKASIAQSVSEQTRNDQKQCVIIFPWKAVTFIGAYSFAYGFASSLQPGDLGYTESRIVPALIVLAVAFLDAKRFNLKVLYNVAFPFMVCGLLLASFVPGLPDQLSVFAFDTSYTAMGLMLILIACSISFASGTSAAWLFGILAATQYLARALGQIANASLNELSPAIPGSEFITPIAIALIIFASIAMLSEKSFFSNWGAPIAKHQSEEAQSTSIKMRIEELSDTYRLSKRESEVLHLLALGKPNVAIARDLFIAEGTVKAHIQHIYQKLDVHTRKELMRLLGTESGKQAVPPRHL